MELKNQSLVFESFLAYLRVETQKDLIILFRIFYASREKTP